MARIRCGTRNVSAHHIHCRKSLRGGIGFVNAQYRFVMNPNGDFTVHFADPDM